MIRSGRHGSKPDLRGIETLTVDPSLAETICLFHTTWTETVCFALNQHDIVLFHAMHACHGMLILFDLLKTGNHVFLITQKNQHRSVPVATMNGLTVHAKGLSLRPTTLE
jgi:hypothetical protein